VASAETAERHARRAFEEGFPFFAIDEGGKERPHAEQYRPPEMTAEQERFIASRRAARDAREDEDDYRDAIERRRTSQK